MSTPAAPTPLSRRDFLKATSVLSGALLGSQWLTALPTAAAHSPALQLSGLVGILAPTLALHPTAHQVFGVGLQGAVAGPRWQVANYENSLDQAWAQAQALLAAGMETMVGWVSPAVAQELQPLFEKVGVPLVASTLGAARPAAPLRSDFVLENSLEWWRASYALGQWAAQQLGPRVFSAADFYASGYDGLYAFQAGVEAAGGAVTQTVVTPYGTMDFAPLWAAIRQTKPDVVFATYSGAMAVAFIEAYAAANLALPLVAAPSMSWAIAATAATTQNMDIKLGYSGPNLADPVAGLSQRAAAHLVARWENSAPAPLTFGVAEVTPTKTGYGLATVADLTPLATITTEHIWSTTPRTGWFHEYGVI